MTWRSSQRGLRVLCFRVLCHGSRTLSLGLEYLADFRLANAKGDDASFRKLSGDTFGITIQTLQQVEGSSHGVTWPPWR